MPERRPRIVHITHREGLTAIFQAQVLTPLGYLSEQGYEVHSVVFAPLGQLLRPKLRARWKDLRRSAEQVLSGGLHILPSPPSRLRGLWNEEKVLRAFLRRKFGKAASRPDLLHCRGSEATVLALAGRTACGAPPVLFDCRGVSAHEILYSSGAGSEHELSEDLRDRWRSSQATEQQAAREADHLFTVSGKLRDYLVKEYGVEDKRVQVVPCCVPLPAEKRLHASRDRIRGDLGWDEAFVVCYSGSMAAWQMPEESARAFLQIQQSEPRARFLGLTTSPETLHGAFLDAGVSPDLMHICRVPQDKVSDWLAAADLGLLLREECLVNQVASPTKFGEYMAAGLPVLISEGVGDYSEVVREKRLGVVASAGGSEGLGPPALPSREDARLMRENCRAYAQEALGWDQLLRALGSAMAYEKGRVAESA